MAINVICGLTGTGKTYFMTKLAQELIENYPVGWKLYANYTLKKDGFAVQPQFINDPHDILDLEKAIVLIDDGAIWFGARQWSKLPWQVQHKVINNRKDGLQVFITTQFFESLDRTFSENCHKYYEAEKLIGSDEYNPNPWGVIRITQYRPTMHDKVRRKAISRRFLLIRKQTTELYDTFEKIEPKPFDRKEAKLEIKTYRKMVENAQELIEKRKRGRPKKLLT